MDNAHGTTLESPSYIRQLGYHVVHIWECTLEQWKKTNDRVAEFSQYHDVVVPYNLYDAFYGGCLNASHLYDKVRPGEKIQYMELKLTPFGQMGAKLMGKIWPKRGKTKSSTIQIPSVCSCMDSDQHNVRYVS